MDAIAERNRDRILAAALTEFATRGFDGATTAGVARRAGVTQPLVHYHFDSKDDLWRAAVTSCMEQLEGTFGGVLNELSDLSPVDRLKVLVRRFVYFSAAHPEFGQILAHEGTAGGQRLDWLLEQEGPRQLAVFADVLRDGADEGWLKPLPMEHVATCLGAAAAYMFIVRATMRQVYGIEVTDPAVVERHADTLVELFFTGLLSEESRLVATGPPPGPSVGAEGGRQGRGAA